MTNRPFPIIDDEFAAAMVMRELLIDPDDAYANDLSIEYPSIDAHMTLAIIRSLDRESLTAELLANSLCPLHRCDYAICFDDDNAECAAIRTIHPSHDS